MLYNIPDEVKHNILVFLDRVEFRGLKEVSVLNEIMEILNSPVDANNVDKSIDSVEVK